MQNFTVSGSISPTLLGAIHQCISVMDGEILYFALTLLAPPHSRFVLAVNKTLTFRPENARGKVNIVFPLRQMLQNLTNVFLRFLYMDVYNSNYKIN